MNKIAIFENLENGGGLNQVKNYVKYFHRLGYKVDIYTHTYHKIKHANNIYYFPVPKSKNSIHETLIVTKILNKKQKIIAKDIINRKYLLILIFPCKITQCPYINKYLNNKNSFYMFLESKREFYENTSFDYLRTKRIIARIIRFPIKLIDKNNCIKTKNIISNSYYSKYILKKIYSKKSTVIYPNLKQIAPIKYTTINHQKFLSVGLISKLKNNNFTIKLLEPSNIKLNLIGNFSNDIHENNNKFVNIFTNINDKCKIEFYKNSTFFMANQISEPFGLTTIEAVNYNNFVFGLNLGGTSEIIQNGLNGILYPNKIKSARKLIEYYIHKKNLITYQTCIIDWKNTVNKIISFTLNL